MLEQTAQGCCNVFVFRDAQKDLSAHVYGQPAAADSVLSSGLKQISRDGTSSLWVCVL